jgi:hypothetical protein
MDLGMKFGACCRDLIHRTRTSSLVSLLWFGSLVNKYQIPSQRECPVLPITQSDYHSSRVVCPSAIASYLWGLVHRSLLVAVFSVQDLWHQLPDFCLQSAPSNLPV